MFTLVVDDFSAKYANEKDAENLIRALYYKYEDVEVNYKEDKLYRIILNRDYKKCTYKLSLPNYIQKLQQQFNLTLLLKLQLAPADYVTLTFRKKQ